MGNSQMKGKLGQQQVLVDIAIASPNSHPHISTHIRMYTYSHRLIDILVLTSNREIFENNGTSKDLGHGYAST